MLYELHIGAYTAEGSFAASARKLDHLAELGVTAVEIMPIGDFRGRWGWGYDGVYPYAPDAAYGRPDDFKAFVEAAHQLGIAVLLDVVYNHFGPEGNYLSSYAPDFFTTRYRTLWGEAIDFDGPNARAVRDFVIENAEYWIDTFRLDGLRLDAVHSIKDDSRPDIVDELAARLRSRFARPIHLLLENEKNEPQRLVRYERRPPPLHGAVERRRPPRAARRRNARKERLLRRLWGHEAPGKGAGRRLRLSGRDLVPPRGGARGAERGPSSRRLRRVHSEPRSDRQPRFRRAADRARLRGGHPGARERLLLLPQTPMLFMGEEWAAAQPFPFFCDFDGDLAEAVRRGRREEFARFPEFADPQRAGKIPDPVAETTFMSAKLDWRRIDAERLGFYRAALAARREHVRPLLPEIEHGGQGSILGEQAIRVVWRAGASRLTLDANLSDGRVAIPETAGVFWRCGETGAEFGPWSVRWSVGAA